MATGKVGIGEFLATANPSGSSQFGYNVAPKVWGNTWHGHKNPPFAAGVPRLESTDIGDSVEKEIHVESPSLGAILLALIPFAATCFSVALWDRVYPIMLGLPFNFFWLILWLLLTPLCMWGAYRLETNRYGSQQGGAHER